MVTPITGPFIESSTPGITGVGALYWSRQVYRQAKPYNLPLPYVRTDRGIGIDAGSGVYSHLTNSQSPSSYGTRSPKRYSDLPSTFKTSVQNAARERLNGKLNSDALLWATLGEAKKTINQMDKDLRQCYAIIRRLVPRSRRVLNRSALARRPGGYTILGVGQAFSNDILKVFFGYMPLMSDVQTCAELLSRDFDPQQVEAYCKRADNSTTGSSVVSNRWLKREEWWYKAKMGCEAQINNPNLYLAQKLGLINPFATAWELMRWSFVVDYFVNVNQFVNSLTDQYGVALTEPYTRENMWSYAEYTNWAYPTLNPGMYRTGIWCREVRASRSLPAVKLGVRQFSLGKDLSRLVTSSALLLQALTRGH